MDQAVLISELAPLVAIGTVAIVIGWVAVTWMRIRHGYPLENSWGNAIYPKTDAEAAERIKMLSQENAQLRAEMSAVKDRLETVEKIVTDRGYALDQEIEKLRITTN